MKISHERLLELLIYNKDSGNFYLRNYGVNVKGNKFQANLKGKYFGIFNSKNEAQSIIDDILIKENKIEIKKVGYKNKEGYIRIKLDGRDYSGHELAWFYTYGEWDTVDHKDRNPSNNAIDNLRKYDKYQLNTFNRGLRIDNSSGYKGVVKTKNKLKYEAKIGINGITKYLGTFNTKEQAADAYDKAAEIHHGEFAYTNKMIKENKN